MYVQQLSQGLILKIKQKNGILDSIPTIVDGIITFTPFPPNVNQGDAISYTLIHWDLLSASSSKTQGRSVGPGEKARRNEAGRNESLQAWAEKPLGTDSHRFIFKRSSECWPLIGHKKCFVLLCPIGEQHLLSSFRDFVNDCYWLDHAGDHGFSGSCTKEMYAVRKLSVWYTLFIWKYCLPEN